MHGFPKLVLRFHAGGHGCQFRLNRIGQLDCGLVASFFNVVEQFGKFGTEGLELSPLR